MLQLGSKVEVDDIVSEQTSCIQEKSWWSEPDGEEKGK
ncbi:hypothetical protein GDO78_014932 [Eleutherodactylus coqui]|uniref:Uncharacterized protein n=1 Tax=Eleutherodactylus coqui TaxID=57060 RepID=A0A8J6E445_ELECQ|nr:hypothetical protein GDO78_014932 [Eleutherodactylus coqui]